MKNSKTLIALILLSVLIVVFDKLNFLTPSKDFFSQNLKPLTLLNRSFAGRFGDFFRTLSFIKSGEARIKNLEEKTARQLVSLNRCFALEKENLFLKEELKLKNTFSDSKIMAESLNFERFLIIDKGQSDGIKVGDTAISKGILVGRVINTGPHFSKIIAPGDPENKISVKILSLSPYREIAGGILAGGLDGEMTVVNIPIKDTFNEGDLISSSGKDTKYPPDLLIGKIKKIRRKDSDVYQSAEVEPLINYRELDYVLVAPGY